AVGAVGVGLDLLDLDLVTQLLLGGVDAGPGGVVEGLVAPPADVVDHPDLLGLGGAATGAGVAALVVAAATRGHHQAERDQQGGDPHTPYPTHALAPLGLQAPTCASAAGWRYLTIPWSGGRGLVGRLRRIRGCAASCWASSCSCSPTSP